MALHSVRSGFAFCARTSPNSHTHTSTIHIQGIRIIKMNRRTTESDTQHTHRETGHFHHLHSLTPVSNIDLSVHVESQINDAKPFSFSLPSHCVQLHAENKCIYHLLRPFTIFCHWLCTNAQLNDKCQQIYLMEKGNCEYVSV